MRIDAMNTKGRISYSSKAMEQENADSMRGDFMLKARMAADPTFLDTYIAHEQVEKMLPSAIFWRNFDGEAGAVEKGAYVRWNWIEKLVLKVTDQIKYHVKVKDTEGQLTEISLADCQLKKITVEFAANTANVELHFFHSESKEGEAAVLASRLTALSLQGEVEISIWSPQQDLVSQASESKRAQETREQREAADQGQLLTTGAATDGASGTKDDDENAPE